MVVRDVNALRKLAIELRLHVVRMMGANKKHHFGGSMSAADIVTALYFYKMRYDPEDPEWPDRDRFIMSKGHCVPAQYAALAMLGVLPLEELPELKTMGSRLQGHPAAHLVPGIEGCTGSLGQGLSFANGMALAARIQHRDYDVYCLIGDGELQEGQIWEAAMTSSKQRLENLTAVIDRNGLKAMDEPSSAKTMDPLADRWRAFGWSVREIDGHEMAEICEALDWAEGNEEAPSMIIAHTIKGKGIPFIEGRAEFHNAALTEEQIEEALAGLEEQLGIWEEGK
ncbi:MAG: transketolase [Chloroflexota bacterium]|nr:transketolase [Chloroflexota bacterium]